MVSVLAQAARKARDAEKTERERELTGRRTALLARLGPMWGRVAGRDGPETDEFVRLLNEYSQVEGQLQETVGLTVWKERYDDETGIELDL